MTDKKQEVPRLSQEVKKMNGKSGYKLRQCIDALCEVLDEKHLPTKDDDSQESLPSHD